MPKFGLGDNKEYKVEAIWDSAVHAKEADGHLLGLYYLVLWKGYLKEENTLKPFLTVMYLRKMVSTFYKDYLEMPTAISAPLDSAPPMAKPTIQLPTKQNRGRPTGHAKKRAKWGDKKEATRKKQ